MSALFRQVGVSAVSGGIVYALLYLVLGTFTGGMLLGAAIAHALISAYQRREHGPQASAGLGLVAGSALSLTLVVLSYLVTGSAPPWQ